MKSEKIFLETHRLLIKIPSMDYFEGLCELNSNAEVMHYIDPACKKPDEVRTRLQQAIEHYEKHGFTFGVVIEKSSEKLIGQAGIIYLAYDDTQPDIEIGYRLHPDYWKKGYATELASALVKWGFKHLSVDKLVAVIHPQNEKSRKVLEKIGMHYLGKKQAYNTEVAEYQILRNTVDYHNIKLVPATIEQVPIMQNLARFYIYDVTEYFGHEKGWEIGHDGLYDSGINFKKYWEDSNAFPYFIYYQNEIAGFVIIDKNGTDNTVDYNMAQFYILRKFTNKGIGKYVAYQCFDRYQGVWEVMIIPGNEGAYRFWRSIINDYTIEVDEYTRKIDNYWRNIFRFNSFKKANN